MQFSSESHKTFLHDVSQTDGSDLAHRLSVKSNFCFEKGSENVCQISPNNIPEAHMDGGVIDPLFKLEGFAPKDFPDEIVEQEEDGEEDLDEEVHLPDVISDMERFEEIPFYIALFTYFSYLLLNIMGKFRDLLRRLGMEHHQMAREPQSTRHFVPLYRDYEAFYTRNLYRRVRDCWNRPICSAPGAEFNVMDRFSPDNGWSFQYPGTVTRCLNFGSYNYLGFAESVDSTTCGQYKDRTQTRTTGSVINEQCIQQFGVSAGLAPRQESVGTSTLQVELEELLAEFTGQEAAVAFPMGFATNALNIPVLVDKHCCIISDELNHTSLILGMRLSGAELRRFRHNDMESLEKELRDAVIYGHSRTHRAYRKILIVVEGIYSMEGSIVRLREVVALKKRYNAYLYLDEAHSIGALGRTGRGVVEYFGVAPEDIDVAMGTFTKSFGSSGGYIAGRRSLISWLRVHSHSAVYAATMSPVVSQQIITVLRTLMDRSPDSEGQKRIRQLTWNTRYFRDALCRRKFIVYGHRASPVVPILVFVPSKVPALSRACQERGLGIVVVGFPAVPLILSRARFCISASHTKTMLDKALSVLDEMADLFRLRYSRLPLPYWINEDAIDKQTTTKAHDEQRENKLECCDNPCASPLDLDMKSAS